MGSIKRAATSVFLFLLFGGLLILYINRSEYPRAATKDEARRVTEIQGQDNTPISIPSKPLDTNFFYNTDLGKAIFAYLSCTDFNCTETLQTIVKKGPDAVWPFTQILQSGLPPEIAATLSGDVPLLVRIRVIEGLGALADTRALNTIVGAALQDSNPLVRAGAARALGKIGGDEALTALLLHLRDSDPLVRETTTQALVELKRPEALSALRDAAESETQEHIRRAIDTAIRVLEKY